ncbi:MAG: DNA-formamidopyrimidine glycosylase [Deltaproteobacteria bacterium]|nr:DNA-formamidopyrimidine glycosylase [Deltaproteobacteria bacterium]MCL4874319.1 DNA-formamidopyrimidine glycosylase [bacterium]
MPELPDVETMRRYFERTSLRKRVAEVEITTPRVIDGSPGEFQAALKGRRFTSVRRHGKYLFASAKGPWLVLHFGMTGGLEFKAAGKPAPPHSRVAFGFADGSRLFFFDTRMFGRAGISDDIDDFIRRKGLGPDALSIGFGQFRAALKKTRRGIKQVLMDQSVLAGLGNVYADEALFQAGIHPLEDAGGLADDKARRLFRAIGMTLRKAVSLEAQASRFPEGFIIPRRHKGARCPRCGAAIEALSIQKRTAYFCPACQRPGRAK